MSHDFGFDLPDARHSFYAKDEEFVTVKIVRHWISDPDYEDEDGAPTFKVSFNIEKGNQTTNLPIGTREEEAIKIAHLLYEEDEESTKELNEMQAMEAAERRMGA